MSPCLMGIDVGGTHTDGVAIDAVTGAIVAKVKTLTTNDLAQCTSKALESLLSAVSPGDVSRVVLSTTLVTNTIAAGHIEPVGMILLAGPGLDPGFLVRDPFCRVVGGAIDHRGREIVPLDEADVQRNLDSFLLQGVSVIAVAGKFSVRNPEHEMRIAAMAEPRFDHVCMAHRLSGALNFPRRAATAYLSAGVWRRHNQFVRDMEATVRKMGITAPLYLLRADGGAELASSFSNPAETALSGPAASIMGIRALDAGTEETVALDIGGTTTDISLFVGGAPLLEQNGAVVGPFKTQIHALFTRSIPMGGDSAVTHDGTALRVGPHRSGPAAVFGGLVPTPTDALVLMGDAQGDRDRAAAAFTPLATSLDVPVEALAQDVLALVTRRIAGAVEATLAEANARPVYTIHEFLENHRVTPLRAVAVGGPAHALAPRLGKALELPLDVAPHSDVANAVGAAVASLSLEVNASADTARGVCSIPEAGVHRPVGRDYRIEDLELEARAALDGLARTAGFWQNGDYEVDRVECETFRIVEDYAVAGSVHRLRLRVRPSILHRIS